MRVNVGCELRFNAPEQVSFIQLTAPKDSKVGFVGGGEIKTVRGKPEQIAAILSGETPASTTPTTITH